MPTDATTTTDAPAQELLPFEVWAERSGTAKWLLAATRARYQWPIGRELTQAAFNEAVLTTLNGRIG